MLHSQDDIPLNTAASLWSGRQGLARFHALVRQYVSDAPASDPQMTDALARALTFAVQHSSTYDVATVVGIAAREYAERLHRARLLAARHHDFIHKPQPARLDPRGASDQGEGELQVPLPTNPHFRLWGDRHG